MVPMLPLPVVGIMPQSAPTRLRAAGAVELMLGLRLVGAGLGLWLVLGVGLAVTLTSGPAPPVGEAGMGGALPQPAAANAMLAAIAAIAARRTCVPRTGCGRIKNVLA
jgi:hypothetical protein